jgi:50S ribosomal protein L16 3-hydroxylase
MKRFPNVYIIWNAVTLAELFNESSPQRVYGFVPSHIPLDSIYKNRYARPGLSTQAEDKYDDKQKAITELDGPFVSSILAGYWGSSPLLIRNAFPNEETWPSWNEILQLSCWRTYRDDLIESGESARLIRHIPGVLNSFELDLGPFDVDELTDILVSTEAKEKSTLILNDVDRYIPTLDDWLNRHFNFLPRWRRDDAQVSLATSLGGIGPHVDNYDVFLIQTAGERVWYVDATSKMTVSEERTKLVPGIPVSLLNITVSGDVTTKFTRLHLQKGDLLYLPPRIVHWGIGHTDDCMTLSVGARAPSASDLVVRVAEFLQESIRSPSVRRYIDVSLKLGDSSSFDMSHSLTFSVKESMKILVQNAVNDLLNDNLVWDSVVGSILTEPVRYSDTFPISYDDEDFVYKETWGDSPKDLLLRVRHLGAKACLRRVAGIAFASSQIISQTDHDGIITVDRLFAHGDKYELLNNTHASSVFLQIERGSEISGALLGEIDCSDPIMHTVETLIERGCLRGEEKVRRSPNVIA